MDISCLYWEECMSREEALMKGAIMAALKLQDSQDPVLAQELASLVPARAVEIVTVTTTASGIMAHVPHVGC